jgi:hypothetical protein
MTLFWIFWLEFWATLLKPPPPAATPQPNGGSSNVIAFRRAA